MKRLVSVCAGLFVIACGFQNCSQSGSHAPNSPLATVQNKIEDPDLKMAEALDILTQSEAQNIRLNLVSGEMTQSSSAGTVKKCLSEGMVSAIQDVIQNSSLCEFKAAEGNLCALVYSHAYANIHWSDKSVKVGESESSCVKGPDLCDQDGRTLRGLLRDVVTRWDEWSCDFKTL